MAPPTKALTPAGRRLQETGTFSNGVPLGQGANRAFLAAGMHAAQQRDRAKRRQAGEHVPLTPDEQRYHQTLQDQTRLLAHIADVDPNDPAFQNAARDPTTGRITVEAFRRYYAQRGYQKGW